MLELDEDDDVTKTVLIDFSIDDLPQVHRSILSHLSQLEIEQQDTSTGDNFEEELLCFLTHVRYHRMILAKRSYQVLVDVLKDQFGKNCSRAQDYLNSTEPVRKFLENWQTLCRGTNAQKDLAGWRLVKGKKGIEVFSRQESDLKLHSMKVHGSMGPGVSMGKYIELLVDVEGLPAIVNGKHVQIDLIVLKEITPIEKIVHFKLHMPWPLTDRDCVVYFQGYDCLEENKIVITGKGIEESVLDGFEIPPPVDNTKRIFLHFATGILEYYGKEKDVVVTSVINLDFRLDVVPPAVLNYFSKIFVYYLFKRLAQTLKSDFRLDTPRRRSPLLYEYFGERLNSK